jgi:hypothetical protein
MKATAYYRIFLSLIFAFSFCFEANAVTREAKKRGIVDKYNDTYIRIDKDVYEEFLGKIYKGRTKEELVQALGEPHKVFPGQGISYRVQILDTIEGDKYHSVSFVILGGRLAACVLFNEKIE